MAGLVKCPVKVSTDTPAAEFTAPCATEEQRLGVHPTRHHTALNFDENPFPKVQDSQLSLLSVAGWQLDFIGILNGSLPLSLRVDVYDFVHTIHQKPTVLTY